MDNHDDEKRKEPRHDEHSYRCMQSVTTLAYVAAEYGIFSIHAEQDSKGDRDEEAQEEVNELHYDNHLVIVYGQVSLLH